MRVKVSVRFGLALLLLSAAAGLLAAAGEGKPRKPPRAAAKPAATNACATCREKRPILDPERFAKGYDAEVKRSYQVAHQYTETLDRIHCFCECQESPTFRHKTLLTCFTDQHAAGCGICIKEALLAADLKKKGAADEEVELTVESIFKTDGHPPTHDHGR
jgi:hypothetical protein